MKSARREMFRLYGVQVDACRHWLQPFHADVERYFQRVVGASLGAPGDTVVVDESLFGVWAMTPEKAKIAQARAGGPAPPVTLEPSLIDLLISCL